MQHRARTKAAIQGTGAAVGAVIAIGTVTGVQTGNEVPEGSAVIVIATGIAVIGTVNVSVIEIAAQIGNAVRGGNTGIEAARKSVAGILLRRLRRNPLRPHRRSYRILAHH